jgi:hypothetical protein
MLQALAEYRLNELSGQLRLWEEDQSHLYYGEYNRGKKHGITCFFKQGTPWLIEEYNRGTLTTQYYVDYASGTAKAIAKESLATNQEDDFAVAVHAQEEFEKAVKENERILKQRVRDECRARIAVANAEARVRASIRSQMIQDEKDASMGANWATALGGLGH